MILLMAITCVRILRLQILTEHGPQIVLYSIKLIAHCHISYSICTELAYMDYWLIMTLRGGWYQQWPFLVSSFRPVSSKIDFIIIHLGMHWIAGGLSYYASSMHGICISGILIPTCGYISYIGGVENTVCIKTMCRTNFLCDRSINLSTDK
jgi:hypothetical protein